MIYYENSFGQRKGIFLLTEDFLTYSNRKFMFNRLSIFLHLLKKISDSTPLSLGE